MDQPFISGKNMNTWELFCRLFCVFVIFGGNLAISVKNNCYSTIFWLHIAKMTLDYFFVRLAFPKYSMKKRRYPPSTIIFECWDATWSSSSTLTILVVLSFFVDSSHSFCLSLSVVSSFLSYFFSCWFITFNTFLLFFLPFFLNFVLSVVD